MKIIETKVFEFGELSDSAKEKARAWYREGALDYDWWDSTYEDAERIGLKITGFDLDRNRHATGSFTMDVLDVAKAILSEHGKDCETHKDATAFLKQVKGMDQESAEFDDACADFLKTILEDYSILLQHEYEYLLSDEAVDEAIQCNGYTFTEAGKRF